MKANRLLIIGLFISLFCEARWEEISTGSTENLTSLEFIGNTGFCGGANGELLKTTNGGNTWIGINSGTSDNITSILFQSASIGFYTTAKGYVYKTINGGSSWTNIKLQTVGALNGIDFLDSDIGLTCGDNGVIYRTDNGGSSWTNLGSISIFVLNDVAFINDTLAVAVGAKGSVFSSSDAGLTWTNRTISSSNSFSAIEKLDNNKAAMIGSAGLYSEFNATQMTASNETSIDTDFLKDIHLSSSGNLYVVGFNQTVLITNPSWKTWDLDSINNLNSVHFVNDTIGFSCGSNGKIYKTTTGGFPVSKFEVVIQPLHLYPNPASNFVMFKNTGTFEKSVKIYSQTGQLIDNKILFGERLDIESLSPGVYFVHLESDKKTYRGKFLKR